MLLPVDDHFWKNQTAFLTPIKTAEWKFSVFLNHNVVYFRAIRNPEINTSASYPTVQSSLPKLLLKLASIYHSVCQISNVSFDELFDLWIKYYIIFLFNKAMIRKSLFLFVWLTQKLSQRSPFTLEWFRINCSTYSPKLCANS